MLWTPDNNFVQLEYEYFSSDPPDAKVYEGGREPQTCVFCGGTRASGAKFKKDAHLIPAAFGNTKLFTIAECDACNHLAGNSDERDLVNFLALERAMSFVSGRKGPIKHRNVKERSYIACNIEETQLEVYRWEGENTVDLKEIDAETYELSIEAPPYRRMGVVRALARLALRSLPASHDANLAHIGRWLRGEVVWQPTLIRATILGGEPGKNSLSVFSFGPGSIDRTYYVAFRFGTTLLVAQLPPSTWKLPVEPPLAFIYAYFPELPRPTTAQFLEMQDAEVRGSRQYTTLTSHAGRRVVKISRDGEEEVLEDSTIQD